jgi:hypothetical protein
MGTWKVHLIIKERKMNDEKNNNETLSKEIPSTASITKLGIKAIAFCATGGFIFFINWLQDSNVFGFVVGGIVLVFGVCSFFSKDPSDKKTGIIFALAGLFTLFSKMDIQAVSGFLKILLNIGAFGLFALGLWNGIRFLLGLKKRT